MMNIKLLILATAILYSINIFAQNKTKLTKEEFELFAKRQDSIKNAQQKTLLKQQASDFEVVTIAGEQISLSELRGKVVVLNFWFTTCKPCIQEIPRLNKEFSNLENKGLIFVSLCTDSKEKVEKFLERMSLSSDFKVVADAKTVAEKYHVFSFPCNMVIDKEGIVKYIHTGYSPNSVVVLKEKP
ncbi:MAG: TlpA family protein disulfide reductase [Chloroflexia bacterium]|nr:TlpA family protein disulfide reductase [Chloroflexia bacterium]